MCRLPMGDAAPLACPFLSFGGLRTLDAIVGHRQSNLSGRLAGAVLQHEANVVRLRIEWNGPLTHTEAPFPAGRRQTFGGQATLQTDSGLRGSSRLAQRGPDNDWGPPWVPA